MLITKMTTLKDAKIVFPTLDLVVRVKTSFDFKY